MNLPRLIKMDRVIKRDLLMGKAVFSKVISPLPLGERVRVRGEKRIPDYSPPPVSLPPQGGGMILVFPYCVFITLQTLLQEQSKQRERSIIFISPEISTGTTITETVRECQADQHYCFPYLPNIRSNKNIQPQRLRRAPRPKG
jgi:hypothetical protein